MPSVSVVMPVYNTAAFVGEAIESILRQTFDDFEYIIIDDGSTDESRGIIQSYAKRDKRIIAYKNKKNQGIGYTRNRLIDLANTNYIASQDSDDISTPQRLAQEYDFLQKNDDYGVVSGNNIIIDEQGKMIGRRTYSDDIPRVILKKSPISQPSSMFRKDMFESIGGYDSSLNYAEDYDLWLRMYANGYKIKNIEHDMLYYRIRKGQTKARQLKQTLRNTIVIQRKAIQTYGLRQTLADRVYHLLEKLLLLLPSPCILWLFTLYEYRGGR